MKVDELVKVLSGLDQDREILFYNPEWGPERVTILLDDDDRYLISDTVFSFVRVIYDGGYLNPDYGKDNNDEDSCQSL